MATINIDLTDHFTGSGVGNPFIYTDVGASFVIGRNQGATQQFNAFSRLAKTALPPASQIQSAKVVFQKTSGPNVIANADNNMYVELSTVTSTGGTTSSPRVLAVSERATDREFFAEGQANGTYDITVTDLLINAIVNNGPFQGFYWRTTQFTTNLKELTVQPVRLEIEYTAVPTAPVVTYPNGGEEVIGQNDITFTASTSELIDQSSIRYQIQVSYDDGASWADIIALTDPGQTTVPFDFRTLQETNLAKIRVRGYDGIKYGAWDESDGVFTISFNTAPLAPTNLSPSSGFRDRTKVIRFSWQHNDNNPGDNQSQAELQWRTQGASTWNDVTAEGINQYYDFNSNTFPTGPIEWRVRTTDQGGLTGDWSNIAVFNSAEPSNAPTLVQPGATTSLARPVIEWVTASQSSYQIVIEDSFGAVVWDTGEVVSNVSARTAGVDLANGATYVVKVRVKNTSGLFSTYISHTVFVSYTPPPKPIIDLSTDEERGSIVLGITNPTPTGTEPDVLVNEVYRREPNGVWLRIDADHVAGTPFTDYTPAAGKLYEYKVRAVGLNGTYRDSEQVSGSVYFEASQIALASDYQQWLEVKYVTDTKRRKARGRTLTQYAGRAYPVADFVPENTESVNLEYIALEYHEVESFYDIADRKEVLLYRDREGRRIFITVDVTDEDEINFAAFKISFTGDRVDYREGV